LTEVLEGPHRLVLSNDLIVEVVKVLRYPKFKFLYNLSESDLLEYSQFLQSVADLVAADPGYRAPLRDPTDLMVLQTADRGNADLLCTNDGDFYDPAVVAFCAAKGVGICDENSMLKRLSDASRDASRPVNAK
jgi:putative PIN family toxin of toxin-antitoxin system